MKLKTLTKLSATTAMVVAIAGCQSIQQQNQSDVKPQPTPKTEQGITIHPYQIEEIKRKNLNTPSQQLDDGQNVSAHRAILKQAKLKLAEKQYDEAEKLTLQAQRLAPQSAETYLYLAFISLEKKDMKNAESLARRGLSFAQSSITKRELWLVMQRVAKNTNNAKLALEAKTALAKL